jgi:hypothetical protein
VDRGVVDRVIVSVDRVIVGVDRVIVGVTVRSSLVAAEKKVEPQHEQSRRSLELRFACGAFRCGRSLAPVRDLAC